VGNNFEPSDKKEKVYFLLSSPFRLPYSVETLKVAVIFTSLLFLNFITKVL